MSSRPCWFIAPHSCTPNGHLKLGNIILNPSNPDIPLYESPSPLPETERIETFSARGAHFNGHESQSAALGIATSFLSFLSGIGIDVATSWSKKEIDQLRAQTMTTLSFLPSSAFTEECAAQKVVRDYARKKIVVNLYMVVGVMIASGASRNTWSSAGRDVGLHVNIDGTLMGAPASAGPSVGLNQAKMIEVGAEDADEFVFAFRLRKMKFKKGEAKLSMRYKSSGFFGKGTVEEKEEEDEEPVPIIFEGLADEDVKGQHFGLEDTETQDETSGQACLCVMPE
ncbi:uncharacterized protein J3D65DRAFT_159482 [Phyllosticta citribraziliensis]|uniref:Uncharacterized protein n=1 Tax=Phyllosticta citribraziliensis TaxID=989973 RepID=A0ABR1L562_9PEZI